MRKSVAYGIAIGTLTFASISQISAKVGSSPTLQSDFGAAYGIGVKGNLNRLVDDLNKVITNLTNGLKTLEKTNSGYKLIEPERLKELKDCLKNLNALLEGVKLARDSNRRKLEVPADINIDCLETLFESLRDILYKTESFDDSKICDKNTLKAKQKKDDAQKAFDKARDDAQKASEKARDNAQKAFDKARDDAQKASEKAIDNAQKALEKAEADLTKATEGLKASLEGIKVIATDLPNLQVPTLQVDANKISGSEALQNTEVLFEKTRKIAESINGLKEAANPVKANVKEQGPENSPQENDGIVGEEPSEAGGAIESSAEPFDFEPPAEDGGIVSAPVQHAATTIAAMPPKADLEAAQIEKAPTTERGAPQAKAALRKRVAGTGQARSQRGASKSRTIVADVAE